MKHIFGKKAGQSGFSLVELMIVVGIIGVLATLALPRFKQFQAKAKLAEAQNVLQHIYTLEQSYSLDNNQFISLGNYGANLGTPLAGNTCQLPNQPPTGISNAVALGLVIEPCVAGAPTPRFQYSVALGANTSLFDANAVTGNVAANRICPGNLQFAITLTQSNEAKHGMGLTGTTSGAPPIGTYCPN